MRIILDTARESITSDFRVFEVQRILVPDELSAVNFEVAHERVHCGVSITAVYTYQVSTVSISFEIPKGTTFNENTWSSDTNEYSIRLELKESDLGSRRPNYQGIMDREFLRAGGVDKDYGITSEKIQNFQGIISREILSVHFKKIRVLCLRHSEEEVNTIYIANRERLLAFGMGSHVRIGSDSRIRNIDSGIIRDIADKFMKMVLPIASAASVSASAAAADGVAKLN